MNSGWKSWVTLTGAMASIAVLATSMCHVELFDAEQPDVEERPAYQFQPWGDDGDRPPPEVDPPEGEKHWVQFVTEDQFPVESNVLVSAPGMWPFVSKETDEGGFLKLPSTNPTKMGGDELQMYEVVARAGGDDGSGYGFWGLIRGPEQPVSADEARNIQVEEGHPLDLRVVDDDGEPITGAYVRVGRDSVGLVHLDYTTGPDGRATFNALPAQSYHVTIDADGFARTTVTINHSGPTSTPLEVTLQDGGALRTPYAWRGPPVQTMARAGESPGAGSSSSTSSGGAASGESGSQSGDDSDGASGAGDATGASSGADGAAAGDAADDADTVQIQVRVADSGGAGMADAWIEARADGRRVDEAISRGRDRVELSVPGGANVDLIATHAYHGEGSKSVGSVTGDEDLVVRLSDDLLSDTPAEDRMVWPDDIEDELELELVDDGRRWLIDRPRSGSLAAQAGFQRSDSLLFVRREGAGYTAVVERDGQPMEISVR